VIRIRTELAAWPHLARWAAAGAILFGTVGGLVGLLIGLFTYVPTAPFAVVEVGLPAAVLGVGAGIAADCSARTVRGITRWRHASSGG